ncbi:MAG TPA: hypothetical protein DIU08_12780, partial [Ktedonobacter sp.]|nr:hypothetical protein [Ktedonobacter sp.]
MVEMIRFHLLYHLKPLQLSFSPFFLFSPTLSEGYNTNQVLTYFQQNRQEMQSIQATELGIRVEQDTYILTGKIDLLKSGQNGLEILDFKTLHRP